MASRAMPEKPGYYWAKWRIASDGTTEGDELTPSDTWEIVEVNENIIGAESMNPEEADYHSRFSVSVPGVEKVQWLDCFVWGNYVASLQ